MNLRRFPSERVADIVKRLTVSVSDGPNAKGRDVSGGRGRYVLRVLGESKVVGDVFSKEPLNHVDHTMRRMLTMENVVISPHLAAWTHETWDRLQDEVTSHVLEVLASRPLTIRSSDPRLANQRDCVYENSSL